MEKITEQIKDVFSKCEVLLYGMEISKEHIIEKYIDYISDNIDATEHNIGVVVEPGTECFDAISIVYFALYSILNCKVDPVEFVNSLQKGDRVSYKYKSTFNRSEGFEQFLHCEFVRLIKQKNNANTEKEEYCVYAELKENTNTYTIPKLNWNNIAPDYSSVKKAKKLKDEDKIRDQFFVSVLDMDINSVPNIMDTSVIIAMPKDRADNIIKGLELRFSDGKKIKLIELVTVSYYSEEGEYPYSGNKNKADPVLKFTRKISVARRLLLDRNGNNNLGVYISGIEVIDRGVTEISELINRKKLKFVFVCSPLINPYGEQVLSENEDARVFIGSKEYLLSNTLGMINNNKITSELDEKINIIIDKDIEQITFKEEPFLEHEYYELRNNLLRIKRYEWETPEKDEFVTQAFSLTNLIKTAVFSFENFDLVRNKKMISVLSPKEKIERLKKIKELFPPYLSNIVNRCIDILEKAYIFLYEKSPKENWVRQYLINNKKKKIALIVPKAYYATILKERISPHFLENTTITTAGRFDDSIIYDTVIFCGFLRNEKFSAANCISGKNTIILLYSAEKFSFEWAVREYERKIRLFEEKSWEPIVDNINMLSCDESVEDAIEIEQESNIYDEIEKYISNMGVNISPSYIKEYSSQTGAMSESEVSKAVLFSDGQKALLTKNYKAYVLDVGKGVVAEIKVDEISEGDTLVFTVNNSETKDIVKEILDNMYLENRLSDEQKIFYDNSKIWKNRLSEYMNKYQYKISDIADKMTKAGSTLQEATIRNWMDEDSHTVGPKKIDSIKHIAKVIGDKDLKENAEKYFSACGEVRSIRKNILNKIGQTIIERLSGKKIINNKDMTDIYDKLDSLAVILQVEKITTVSQIVPTGLTNRPLNI